MGFIEIFGRNTSKDTVDYEVRTLEPAKGIKEDPISGYLNVALAKWVLDQGCLKNSLTIAKGPKVGPKNRIGIDLLDRSQSAIKIGGDTLILIEGHVFIRRYN